MADIDDILGKEEVHPAYGMIGVSRHTVTPPIGLYGSSIRHSSTIALTIRRSSLRRNLHDDRHYGREILVEVEMSPTQFAEMVSSHGVGQGVPCTIRHVKGEGRIPDPPTASKREQFVAEFDEKIRKVARLMDEALGVAREMAEKPTVGKSERKEFVHRLAMLRQEIASSMPFVADKFNEQMDKTVAEAKGEVDAFITNLIHHTGITALRKGYVALDHADYPEERPAIEPPADNGEEDR